MKRHLGRALVHAVFFIVALLIGIFGVLTNGFDALMNNTQAGSIPGFVTIYLLLVVAETIVMEKMRKRETPQIALSVTLALAASIFAFIIWLFAAYALDAGIQDRLINGLIAVTLYVAIETVLNLGVERLAQRFR